MVGSIVLAGALLACSKPEAPAPAPAPAAPPTAAAAAKPAAAKPAADPQSSPRPTLQSIVVHTPAGAGDDPRRKETPCDRQEAGWKWVGNVVEDGRCAVGPCDCVKE
jgi:hypothetical protein